MDNKTRCVDYGRDIADLRAVVVALQRQVAHLQNQLEDSRALYGGAYSTMAVGQTFNLDTGEFI